MNTSQLSCNIAQNNIQNKRTDARGAASTGASASEFGIMCAPNRSLDFPANRLTEEEAKGLVALKAYLKDHPLQPPSARKLFDDFDLAKFVVVAKCDSAKCKQRMQNFVNYRIEYKVDEVTMQEAAEFKLSGVNLFDYGVTINKEGRASSFTDAARCDPKGFKTERHYQLLVKLFFMYMDLMTSTISLTRNGAVFIMDMRNYGWNNFDRRLKKKFAGLYQDCYPIKLHRILMVNPPWYINAIMAITKLLIKKKIADRMQCVWTENAAKNKLLSTHASPQQVPVELGGKLDETFHACIRNKMGLRIDPTKVNVARPAAPKSVVESSSLSFYSNSKCVRCGKPACDATGKRIGDSRVCAVCGAWYCVSCLGEVKLVASKRRYKHKMCKGHKSKFNYPYESEKE